LITAPRSARANASKILVDELLNYLGAQSQRDKRKPWMLNSARLLVEKYDGSAHRINELHKGDVIEILWSAPL